MEAMKETFAELATHNERLEQELSNCRQELSHCRQELARRDKMLAEHENVLHVRDNLISVLHTKDAQVHAPGYTRKAVRTADGSRDGGDAEWTRGHVSCRASGCSGPRTRRTAAS